MSGLNTVQAVDLKPTLRQGDPSLQCPPRSPIIGTGAMLFFQLLTRPYEHASTSLTSKNGLEDWGGVFRPLR